MTGYLSQQQVDTLLTKPCREYDGRLNHDGYARVRKDGRQVMLHRWAWEQVNGPIPEGMEIDHLCRNRACSEVTHLEVVTHEENVRRSRVGQYLAERTACKSGHPYTPGNTRRDSKGARVCRECARTAAREHYRRKAGWYS